MNNNTNNGWSNYGTSVVAHWINIEMPSQRHWRGVAWQYQEEAVRSKEVTEGTRTAEAAAQYSLADELEEAFSHHPTATENSVYGDLLKAALSEVNWQEIAKSLLDYAEPVDHPLFGPVISAYSREQAIRDGVLIDVTETAKEAGIVYPTAVTQAVWADYVKVPEGVPCQDEEGRLWDILTMFRFAAKQSPSGNIVQFRVLVKNDEREAEEVTLKAICGPGDTPEPVITVMLPNED